MFSMCRGQFWVIGEITTFLTRLWDSKKTVLEVVRHLFFSFFILSFACQPVYSLPSFPTSLSPFSLSVFFCFLSSFSSSSCLNSLSISAGEGVPLVLLVMFSSQGDNIPDALQLATITDSWLKLRQSSVSLRLLQCVWIYHVRFSCTCIITVYIHCTQV